MAAAPTLTGFAFAPAPTVHAVEVEGGVLLVDEATGIVMPLNPTGGLTWACFDGQSTLDDICDDLADGFRVPREQVTTDIETLAHRLLDARMLTAPGSGHLLPVVERDSCCSTGAFAVDGAHAARVHQLVHDGLWLSESADSCRDERYLLGAHGEVVVGRVHAPDGSPRLVGIRTNDLDGAAVVRERLGPLLAEGEPFGFPNISILLGARRGRVTDLSVVKRRGTQIYHTFSHAAAIDAGLRLLHTFVPRADDLTTIQARALERDGTVVLVDAVFAETLDTQHRRLTRAGFRSHPHAPILVDATKAVAYIPRGDDLATPDLEALPIADVVVTGAPPSAARVGPFDLTRVVSLVRGVDEQLRVRAADVRALADLSARVPLVWVGAVDRSQLIDALLRL